MKTIRLFVVVAISSLVLYACGSNDSANSGDSSTASDTITNVTNPGVGSAADDTLSRP